MTRYMLDTSTVSHLLRSHPKAIRRLKEVPTTALCISAVTEGELLFGLARRPEATRLQIAVRAFLQRVDVLPWDSGVAQFYGTVRAKLESQGKTLAPLDLLIATHALNAGAVFVSSDKAMRHVAGLKLENWAV
jgi:tRNA(fMet)-specific endonuclease VapC